MWIFKEKLKEPNLDSEFALIWYQKIKTDATKTIYSQPCRSKVKASSLSEAKKKLEQLIFWKVETVIVEEKNFDTTEVGELTKMTDKFSEIFDEFGELFNKF